MAESDPNLKKDARRSMRPVDAATLVLWRRRHGAVEVLMGRRHKNHVFMPHAWVFPGGRVDRADSALKPETALRQDVKARLERAANPTRARAIAAAGVHEVFEETGLMLGTQDDDAPGGFRPRLDGLDYFFRAITPPGRSRRFDARFLVAEADESMGDITGGDGELLDAAFFPMEDARNLDIAGITRIALAEFDRWVADPPKPDPERPVPLSRFLRGRYYITPE